VRSFSAKEIAELKTTLANIYTNLDSLEPEIREANDRANAKTNGAKANVAQRRASCA